MKDSIITLALVLTLMTHPVITAQAQETSPPAGTFAWNLAAAVPGTLSRYQLTTGQSGTANPKTLDFWVYQAESGRIETMLARSGAQGDGASAIVNQASYLDVWTLDEQNFQFVRHLRRNLSAEDKPGELLFDSLFDTGAKWLRTQYSSSVKGQTKIQSNLEAMPWSPMLWHRDLGMYFTAFFPHLGDKIGNFTVCLDSYSHLILMSVISKGTESIAGIACKKYGLKGQGLLSGLLHTGTVWISEGDNPRLVRQELDIGLSWTLPRFQLQLKETSFAGPEVWLSLQKKTAAQDSLKK